MEKAKNTKKRLIDYGISICAGIFAFLLALNIRSIVLLMYRVAKEGQTQWADALLNSVTVILSMIAWMIYVLLLHDHLDKKCKEKARYYRTFYIAVLPLIVVFAGTQIFLTILS